MSAVRTRNVRLRREAWGFAIGSLLFMLGSVPAYALAVGPVLDALTFFVGSVFFTLAAAVQLALSGRPLLRRDSNRPDVEDWLSTAVQFAGTILFNVSTLVVLITAMTSSTRGEDGWRPDAFGSVAFLASSALAVAATTQRDRLWDPHARTWRCTWLNMAGAVLFAASAVGAFVAPSTGTMVSLFWANAGTFTGALCFFTAALLSRRIAASEPEEAAPRR